MQMRFDETAPGGSVGAVCRLENGKAILEWSFHLIKEMDRQEQKLSIPLSGEEERSLLQREKGCIRLLLTDRQHTPVLECVQKLDEEEPLQSILLQPELWRGIGNPCLYGMEAVLTDGEGNFRDKIQGHLALRCLHCLDRNGKAEILLNNEPFEPKMVRYTLPGTGTEAVIQRQLLEDLQWMGKLGANCICLEDEPANVRIGRKDGGDNDTAVPRRGCAEADAEMDRQICKEADTEMYQQACAGETAEADARVGRLQRLFMQLCDRTGFLVFRKDKTPSGYLWGDAAEIRIQLPSGETLPSFRGNADSLFLPGSSFPTSLFYKYQAKWSRAPFVHILPESIRKLPGGSFSADCYSNCDRVALYTDGTLFEFKSGEREFHFQEIPVRTPSIMLTAEGDGCSHTISLHKSFTK